MLLTDRFWLFRVGSSHWPKLEPTAAKADDLSMDSRLERLLCFVARLSARGGTKIRF